MGGGGMGGGGMGGGGMGGGGNQDDVPQMNPRILAAMLAAKGMRVPDGLLASANASANVSSGPPSQRALYSSVYAWPKPCAVDSGVEKACANSQPSLNPAPVDTVVDRHARTQRRL